MLNTALHFFCFIKIFGQDQLEIVNGNGGFCTLTDKSKVKFWEVRWVQELSLEIIKITLKHFSRFEPDENMYVIYNWTFKI